MTKKIIALMICIVFMMSSMCVRAVDETEISAVLADYSAEMQIISAVSPGYALPEDAEFFSRIEFVRLIVDVMCPQGAGECETGFTDVPSDDENAPSLRFAKDFGIVSPGAEFNPDEYVTYNQALKMAVTAAGYKPLADANGAYPLGYITIAQNLELTLGLEGTGEEKVSIKDGLRLICNLFDATVFVQKSFGDEYVYSADDEITFLSHYHRIHTVYGTVYANEHSSLTNPDDTTGDGRIKISTGVYKMAEDFSSLLGYRVKAYVKNEDTVIYAGKYETEELVISSDRRGFFTVFYV